MVNEMIEELGKSWLGFPVFVWFVGSIALFSFVIQLYYIFRYYWFSQHEKERESTGKQPGVSIIVCARNEERNLMENVPKWLEQDYPNYELIVVNDSSYDDTADILKALSITYPQMHVVSIDEEKQNMQGKKFALTLGIKAAKHDIVLLTDADCVPRSSNWISAVINEYRNKTEMVLGYSPFHFQPGWFNKLMRMDNVMVGLSYLGAAKSGKPYMGVGRNLSYKTELFFKVGGFKSHYSLSSGDDDLFVNQVSSRQNTSFVMTPDSQTISWAKKTYKDWIIQKRRHLTTSPLYKSSHKRYLIGWPLSWMFLIVMGVTSSFFLGPYFWIPITLLFLRIVFFQFSMYKFLRITQQKTDLVWLSPILEFQLYFFQLYLYILNLIRKPKKWS
jgi:glycosyltransferase involved in cell wall biosynthesis